MQHTLIIMTGNLSLPVHYSKLRGAFKEDNHTLLGSTLAGAFQDKRFSKS